jgi:hypothetical protein
MLEYFNHTDFVTKRVSFLGILGFVVYKEILGFVVYKERTPRKGGKTGGSEKKCIS